MKFNLPEIYKRNKEYNIDSVYDKTFEVNKEYKDNLPDLQNGDSIKGSRVSIPRVGISNFRLPLQIPRKDGTVDYINSSIVGTVSLDAMSKGINMSRILRSFYKHKNELFTVDHIHKILKSYQTDLGSFDAHILISFDYRMWQESLRSKQEDGTPNGGWQYYKVVFDNKINGDEVDKTIHFDFVYSSTCPCSTELSLNAMDVRGVYATPHSQRSVMRISVKPTQDFIWIEDLQELCQTGLKTETLVFCKREDEQAFAELNASNTKFVEDAVRLVYEQLDRHDNITDFKIVASHNESLHSHDAISILSKGVNGGFDNNISVSELKSLIY